MAKFVRLPDSRCIRLLSLDSNSISHRLISATMFSKNLNDPELQTSYSFDALSYVWGPADNSSNVILVNGWSCAVRENLWSYLKHSTNDANIPRLLWVDALCIDQDNVDERNNQVRLMPEIYRTAQSVVVWLGPADLYSDMILDFAEKEHVYRSSHHHHRRRNQSGPSDEVVLREAVENFVRREYWSRTWIIQEFLLGRNLKIRCGGRQVSGFAAERLCSSVSWILESLEASGQTSSPIGRQHLFKQRLEKTLGPRKVSLLELIARNQYSLCSDPHDKIFALLGLVTDPTNPVDNILVDYRQPLEELLAEVLVCSNVHPKDIFRYASLLKDYLQIGSGKNAHIADGNVKPGNPDELTQHRTDVPLTKPSAIKFYRQITARATRFNAQGFRTGKIVTVATGDTVKLPPLSRASHSSNSMAYQPNNDNKNILDGILRDSTTIPKDNVDKVAWDHFAAELTSADLVRLQAPMQTLRSISERCTTVMDAPSHSECSNSAPRSAGSASRPDGDPTSVFAIAVVLFSQRANQHFAPALTYGSCKKGDLVVQFPGFDVGLTVACPSHSEPLMKLTGRLMCSTERSSGEVSAIGIAVFDQETRQRFKFDIIQSPSDCRPMTENDILNLQLTSSELLQLVR